MTSASLELCEELYELSGWVDTTYFDKDGKYQFAYDLGYLLRKLPNMVKDDDGTTVVTDDASDGMPFSLTHCEDASWVADYQGYLYGHAATPEDAVAKLAIELFKQGILK